MPRRELKNGEQVANWLEELSRGLKQSGNITLIGSAALLWLAYDRGLKSELPEASMDVDALTDSDEIALHCYEALIGSEFERTHGWHVNLMPDSVTRGFPLDWEKRAARKQIGLLQLIVPIAADLLTPKLKRNDPRDRLQAQWAQQIGLLEP